MSVRLEPEPLQTESRFRPDTVQKAVALAQQMEQERRETLSLEEVTQLAEELNLDPQILQQALSRVSAAEAQTVLPQAGHRQAAQLRQHKRAAVLLPIAFMLAFPLLSMALIKTRIAPVAPPVRVATQVQSVNLVENGALIPLSGQAGMLPVGSRALPGWTITGNGVDEVLLSGTNQAFLRLGRHGGLRQEFATTPGQRYQLQLRLSGAWNRTREFHQVQVRVGNVTTRVGTFQSMTPGAAPAWEDVTMPFLALTDRSIIEISSDVGPREGAEPYVDSITITPQ
jgi:hypothetical protein